MNVTVEPSDELPDGYRASASPPTTEQIIMDDIKSRGEILSTRLPTYQRSSVRDTESLARSLAEQLPCRRILFVRITDSTHAGDGVLYDVSNDTPEVVEMWSGYENANGADVVGYFREEHHIKGSDEDPW